jgi:hypothetical protein
MKELVAELEALQTWSYRVTIITVIVGIIVSVIVVKYDKKIPYILAILAGIVGIPNLYMDHIKTEKQKEIDTKQGRISATNGQLNSFNSDITIKKAEDNIKYFTVRLGSNELNIPESELNSGTSVPLVVYNESDPMSHNITLRTFNNKIFINATVRSFEGKIVAKIINNEWQTSMVPQHYDRNYDDKGFEIIDSYGVIVLQVSMNNDQIKILGVNDRETNKDFILNDSLVLYSPQEGINRYIQLGKYIKPLFKYPSKDNIGVRES